MCARKRQLPPSLCQYHGDTIFEADHQNVQSVNHAVSSVLVGSVDSAALRLTAVGGRLVFEQAARQQREDEV